MEKTELVMDHMDGMKRVAKTGLCHFMCLRTWTNSMLYLILLTAR